MSNLAFAQLSAARQRSLQLIDFRRKRTTLPDEIIRWNGTYTRNSVKTVVQDGALVTLSANQFGTSYDDVTGLYGYVPEPAATNLATNSDGNASTYTVSNVSDGTAVPGFSNGLAFGNNSSQRSATKAISVTSGTVYSISAFVIMDDGNAPTIGAASNSGDFSITLNGVIATNTLVRRIGGSLYRVSASITASATASHAAGITKYTGQSARTFRITGIQVETGSRATSYIATTSSTASRASDVLSIPLWVNNLPDSQNGSTSNWSKNNCTVTTSGTAPDGTSTAQLVTTTATSGVALMNTGVKAPAGTVTYSVRVKKGNRSTILLLLRNNTTSTNFTAGTMNFDTGLISGSGWTAADIGSGWFLCTFTQSTGITVGDTLHCYAGYTGGASTVGDTHYFWGAQLEHGSTATTYRKTVGTTLENTNNRNIPGFDSDGYTLFADGRMDTIFLDGYSRSLVYTNNLSTSEQVYINMYMDGSYVGVHVAGTRVVNTLIRSLCSTRRARTALSLSVNNSLSSSGGVAGSVGTSFSMPSLTVLTLGVGSDSHLNGFLFSAGLIPRALTQAQINALTVL